MQAESSVELAAGDPTLTVPWQAPDGSSRYYDLRGQPDLLIYVSEAARYPELGEFLARVNSARSPLQSAKCDVWFTTELGEEEQGFGAQGKFGGYVDLFFSDSQERSSFPHHEQFARRLAELLARAPELPSLLELIVRRAYFERPEGEVQEGFYFTCYVFGFGGEEEEARRRWAVALKLVENALGQLARNAGATG